MNRNVRYELIIITFVRQHKCRNFEAVRDWVTERQVFTTDLRGIERVPGSRELDVPP